MQRSRLIYPLLLALMLAGSLQAQEFSYDGNRWYEIEVSIFTNQTPRNLEPELFLPERSELLYPDDIIELLPATTSYIVDFDSETADMPEENTRMVGAENRTAGSGFSIIDLDRAPFVALGRSEHQFTGINRSIDNSPDHRLLFHAVWRQPLLNRSQATAVFVSGGDTYGRHSELEGSLILSLNGNRVNVEAHLWRNSFGPLSAISPWLVPPQPFPPEDSGIPLGIDEVYLMRQTRDMVSNELHYLDHPAFGLIIEVRPYVLPNIIDFSLD